MVKNHNGENLLVYVIIPAAGQGSRMGADKNKQFLELNGVPVIARTLNAFQNFEETDKIIIIANSSEQLAVEELCKKYNITKFAGVAIGGDTRQDSVRNALNYLKQLQSSDAHSIEENIVLIHDGVRPFVSDEVIKRCVYGAIKFKACGAGVPVKDTIKKVDKNGIIINTPPRESLWAIQTPQAFLFSMILNYHNKAYASGLKFTDDTAVAEHYGEAVHMVMGDYKNIKITTPEDLSFGETLLANSNLGFGLYAVADMETNEKTQAKIRLMSEIATGERAGTENGRLSIEDVKAKLL